MPVALSCAACLPACWPACLRPGCHADELWLPNTDRPDWLDGTLPGDRGFDPLGLAKPSDYLQVSNSGQTQSI